VTNRAAFFTDSQKPVLYRVALSRTGAPGALTTIPLTGEYQHMAGFNLNGIVATANGKALIAVQTAAKKLFLINPSTGSTKMIDIGTYNLENGDGLLLHGTTLYVVQNRSNKIAVFTPLDRPEEAVLGRSPTRTSTSRRSTVPESGSTWSTRRFGPPRPHRLRPARPRQVEAS
jgi:streptogramin lyase